MEGVWDGFGHSRFITGSWAVKSPSGSRPLQPRGGHFAPKNLEGKRASTLLDKRTSYWYGKW